jgi:hypothetical protein
MIWYQIMGHKGDSFKACVHWDREGSNPITTLNSIPHILKDANDWSNSLQETGGPGSSVGIATGYGLEGPGI